MKLLIFALLLTISIVSNAQDIVQEFGKVSFVDLNLKEYSKDKAADAVVLFDKGTSYFVQSSSGFEIIFERKFRIKIFKKSGLKWGEVEIPYYYSDETLEQVSNIKAISYNIENYSIKRDEVEPKSIFDEKTNEYWRKKKFALPNVKEGTVIEVSYTITSPRIFEFRDWDFQTTIPTVYSEYIVKMIPFYTYKFILQGRSKIDVFESYEEKGLKERFMGIEYNNMNYKFGMTDIPAFYIDPFITSYNDYILKIDFQLTSVQYPDGYKKEIITTWPKMIDDLIKTPEFGRFVDASKRVGSKTLNLPELAGKPKSEQLETIINYVKTNYNWDGYYGIWARKSLKDFQKEKTGSIGNINLFLAGLLKAAGFEADPVIISTRKHGKIKSDYPFFNYFDYVLVMVVVDGKNMLVDATEPMLPYTNIPARCINEKGLLIQKNNESWVNLTNSEPSYINHTLNLSFSDNTETLNCSINKSYTLYEAYDIKSSYKNDQEKIKEAFLEKGYTKIDSIQTENYNETLKDYIIKAKGTCITERIDDKLYVSPFLYEAISQNPLKQASRQYPVDFTYPFGKKFRSVITLPDGYKADFLPQPQKINNDKISFEYQVTTIDDKHILVSCIYVFTKAVYEPDEYNNIKFYYNEIVKKLNEKIVLVKE